MRTVSLKEDTIRVLSRDFLPASWSLLGLEGDHKETKNSREVGRDVKGKFTQKTKGHQRAAIFCECVT